MRFDLIWRFLARYARPNLPQYVLGAIMLVATNWVVVRIPAVVGQTLNVLEAGGPQALVQARGLGLELVVLGLIVIVVRTLSRILFFNPGRDIEHKLCLDLFDHLLSLQRNFYLNTKIGELASVASNDATSVRLLIGFSALQLCNVIVAVPMHLYQMVITDVVLTIWCMVPVLIGSLYMRITVNRFFGMVRESMGLLARISDRVLESYAGIGTIRAHAVEDATVRRFEEFNRRYLDLQVRIAGVRAFGMPALAFSGFVAMGFVLWVGGNRVIDDTMEVGALATFTALLVSLVSILTSFAWVLAAISRGLVSLKRVDDVLQTPVDLPPTSAELEIKSPPKLEIRDLSFSYPDCDTPALQGITATVHPGQTLGIFGKTGAGKTTLVELVARIQTPPAGTVFVDGIDINDASLAQVRDAMSVVPQAAFLFSTSLRDNIALEQPPNYEPELERVIRCAALGPDIEALPIGLDTIVGERGVMLSGGQRQRAALARALYRNRPLFLLDDVLSAVDQGTEAQMVQALQDITDTRAQKPTTVIVSHRPSVLEHADEIIVLECGRLIERGSHEQLLALGGEYAEAYLHQAAEGHA